MKKGEEEDQEVEVTEMWTMVNKKEMGGEIMEEIKFAKAIKTGRKLKDNGARKRLVKEAKNTNRMCVVSFQWCFYL